MPRVRVDRAARESRRTAENVERVLAQLRALGALHNPDDPRFDALRPTALRAFVSLLKDTRAGEALAKRIYEALRTKPQLVPGATPGATVLLPRGFTRVQRSR
jgi:hypothetical protein